MAQTFKLYLITKVTDKNGKVVHKKTRACHSLLKQFLQTVEAQMFPSLLVYTRDVDNVQQYITDHAINLSVEAASANATFGIAVGTGTTAPTNIDYKLETKIAHGVGAGQLSYGAMSETTTGVVGANVDYILTRTFVNSSGGTIQVTEAGLIIIGYASAANHYFQAIRDTFTAVPVANGQTLTVNYTLRTTV